MHHPVVCGRPDGRPDRARLARILAALLTALAAAIALPAATLGQAPARHGTEPNDMPAQASGPLAAGVTYADALETDNDRDTFSFYTSKPNAQLIVDYANTTVPPAVRFSSGNRWRVEILDAGGRSLALVGPHADASPGDAGQLRWTLPRAGRYYLQVRLAPGYASDGEPLTYTFTANAGGLLVGFDPAKCAAARKTADTAARTRRAAQAALTRARRAHQPTAALKSRLTRAHAHVAATAQAAATACTNPPTTTALRAPATQDPTTDAAPQAAEARTLTNAPTANAAAALRSRAATAAERRRIRAAHNVFSCGSPGCDSTDTTNGWVYTVRGAQWGAVCFNATANDQPVIAVGYAKKTAGSWRMDPDHPFAVPNLVIKQTADRCRRPAAQRDAVPIATAAALPVVGEAIRMDWTGSFPKGVGTVIITAQVSGATKVSVTMIGRSVRANASGGGSSRTWKGVFNDPKVTDYAAKPKPHTVRIKACGSSGCTHATRTLYPPAVPPGAPGHID